MLGLLATTAALSIGTQLADVTVQANIPFSFTVGDTTLPPSNYSIRELEPSNPAILEIRSEICASHDSFICSHPEQNKSRTICEERRGFCFKRQVAVSF